jgi:hypothetical protein
LNDAARAATRDVVATLDIRSLLVRYATAGGDVTEELARVDLAMRSGEFTVAIGAVAFAVELLMRYIERAAEPWKGRV